MTDLPGVRRGEDTGQEARLELDPGADPQAVIRTVVNRVAIGAVRLEHPSLEDIYLERVGAPPSPAGEAAVVNPSQVVKVARREYLARVRSRAFIFMTVMIPLLMGGYMFLMPLLFTSSGVEELRIAVVDVNTGFGPALGEQLAAIERPRARRHGAGRPARRFGERPAALYRRGARGTPRRLSWCSRRIPTSGRAGATTPARPATP